MKQGLTLLLLSAILLITACQKEVSFENGGTPSDGSLQSDISGDCLPKNVVGTYQVGTALVAANNYIEVSVNVTATGSYTIKSDTVNGISFKAVGTFTSTGTVVVKLSGSGTPQAAGIDNFLISYGSSVCVIQVTTTPVGGGTVPAVFTLDGNPGTCMNYVISGTYVKDVVLTSANTVVIKVTVTTAGTYNISTVASNGMVFSGSGTLALGNQTITLTGSGTPLAAGNTNIPVTTPGGSSCSFTCTVTAPPPSAFDYFPRTTGSNWSYQFDDVANDSILVKVIAATKTALGNTFNIFMQTDDATQPLDSSGYYRKAGGDYFQFVNITRLWGFDNNVWMEYIMLKDNVAANTAWQSAPFFAVEGANSGNVRLNYKVSQKDVTVVVNGTSYTNVIVVDEKLDLETAPGTWTDTSPQAGFSRSYYARDKGLIKFEILGPASQVLLKMETRRLQVF